jgi:hypothetical protein
MVHYDTPQHPNASLYTTIDLYITLLAYSRSTSAATHPASQPAQSHDPHQHCNAVSSLCYSSTSQDLALHCSIMRCHIFSSLVIYLWRCLSCFVAWPDSASNIDITALIARYDTPRQPKALLFTAVECNIAYLAHVQSDSRATHHAA